MQQHWVISCIIWVKMHSTAKLDKTEKSMSWNDSSHSVLRTVMSSPRLIIGCMMLWHLSHWPHDPWVDGPCSKKENPLKKGIKVTVNGTKFSCFRSCCLQNIFDSENVDIQNFGLAHIFWRSRQDKQWRIAKVKSKRNACMPVLRDHPIGSATKQLWVE